MPLLKGVQNICPSNFLREANNFPSNSPLTPLNHKNIEL